MIYVAKSIMIQGTMSNVGKSVIAAALCRIFTQDGYSVAPFKSQNMALNSYVTSEGLEMGRAQVTQGLAAKKEPSVLMNPILLKPTSDRGSQVIVGGRAIGNMKAAEYFKYKTNLIPHIMEAYNTLAAENDIIVIEGAGSPAEINLKENDIVNMGMAKMADAPVLLVGDINPGGIFAQLYGTAELLEKEERDRIKGFIINKFRGDVNILKPGLTMIEDLTHIKVAGVVPYGDFKIDDEDSLSQRLTHRENALIDIAVIRLPKISNFTDFTVFDFTEDAAVRYVDKVEDLGNPDMIILPGSKNTVADMKWLRESGLESAIKRYRGVVFGICGGYQMLGKTICDTVGAESGASIEGMGLLGHSTEYKAAKLTTQVKGTIPNLTGTLKDISGMEYEGYEIHSGDSNEKSAVVSKGNVYGSYVHGIFDNCAEKIVRCLCREKGIEIGDTKIDYKEMIDKELDKLAYAVREALDMEFIYKILNKEV